MNLTGRLRTCRYSMPLPRFSRMRVDRLPMDACRQTNAILTPDPTRSNCRILREQGCFGGEANQQQGI